MPFIISEPNEEKKMESSPGRFLITSPDSGEQAESEKGFWDSLKSAAGASAKGLIKGIESFGRVMGPLITSPEQDQEQIQNLQSFLNKNIPTQEGFTEKALERGFENIPLAVGSPGGTLATGGRALVGGILGETAKEIGLPKYMEVAAELSAYIGPDLTKKLIETGKNKEIIKHGKELGLTEDQIAPLLKKDFKEKWLSKLSPRRGRTTKILSETKEGLDTARSSLSSHPEAKIKVPENILSKFEEKFNEIKLEVPDVAKKLVKNDIKEFFDNPITINSMLRLHKHINKNTGSKTKELSLLKKPIEETINKVSPELGEKFGKINNLYTRYFDIAKKLEPTIVSDIINSAEVLGILGSLIVGDPTMISKFVATRGAQIGARELLLNPRLQQISETFLHSLNQGKIPLAKKIYENFGKEVSKIDPKLSLDKLSEDEFKEIFTNQKDSDQK